MVEKVSVFLVLLSCAVKAVRPWMGVSFISAFLGHPNVLSTLGTLALWHINGIHGFWVLIYLFKNYISINRSHSVTMHIEYQLPMPWIDERMHHCSLKS
jgi:hypothetical protein